jgi:hypothetical protein
MAVSEAMRSASAGRRFSLDAPCLLRNGCAGSDHGRYQGDGERQSDQAHSSTRRSMRERCQGYHPLLFISRR